MYIDIHGIPAYCYTGGKPFDPTLPCTVWIHGAQNDHSVWGLQTRYVAHHGFGVLAVDLPGHGRSAGPALTSIEAMACWLLALVKAAGVRQDVTFIGHSMGALIAMQAAAQAPFMTLALAMVGCVYPIRVSTALLEAAQDAEGRAIDMVNIWSHHSGRHTTSSPVPGMSVLHSNRRLMQKIARLPRADPATPGIFLTDFLACQAYTQGEQAAAGLSCPTLLLLGEMDQMTPPKAAAALQAMLPAPQVQIVPHCGHALMAEQPDAVLKSLHDFAKAAFLSCQTARTRLTAPDT